MRSGPDLNGDSLRISTACQRISDHCRVTVRVGVRVRVIVSVRVQVSLGLMLHIVVYKLLEKMAKCGSIT